MIMLMLHHRSRVSIHSTASRIPDPFSLSLSLHLALTRSKWRCTIAKMMAMQEKRVGEQERTIMTTKSKCIHFGFLSFVEAPLHCEPCSVVAAEMKTLLTALKNINAKKNKRKVKKPKSICSSASSIGRTTLEWRRERARERATSETGKLNSTSVCARLTGALTISSPIIYTRCAYACIVLAATPLPFRNGSCVFTILVFYIHSRTFRTCAHRPSTHGTDNEMEL